MSNELAIPTSVGREWQTDPCVGYEGKRTFDLRVAGTLLFLTFPAIVVAIMAVFAEDVCNRRLRSPIFRQKRVGQYGGQLIIWKIRTMENGSATKVGRFLRRRHIDEFPQLFHVVSGKMSIVGPRPHTPEDYAKLQILNPNQSKLLRHPPGLISPVCLRGKWEELHEKDPTFDPIAVNLRYFKREDKESNRKLLALAIRKSLKGLSR